MASIAKDDDPGVFVGLLIGLFISVLFFLVGIMIGRQGVITEVERCGIEGIPYKVGNHSWRIVLDKPTGTAGTTSSTTSDASSNGVHQ